MVNRCVLGILVLSVFVTICLSETSHLRGSQDKLVSPPQKVLFIGNSYTAQIKTCLMHMLEDSPYTHTTFEFITKGGATLDKHLDDQKTLKRIKAGSWDVVVLQDQSQIPALPGQYAESFQASVDKFAELIRSAGAEPVLYMTWGRRDGDKSNRKLFPDYEAMQRKLSNAYRDAAKRNRITLASVGDAWAIVRKKDTVLGGNLYKQDGSHPSSKGAFLAACVFFRVLFHDSLETIQGQGILQQHELQIIKNAVLNTKSISHDKPDAGDGK